MGFVSSFLGDSPSVDSKHLTLQPATMFTVTFVRKDMNKSAAVHSGDSVDLDVCRDIMSRIVEEDPTYWPHGLSPEMLDGGTYLVRAASTKEPVGFVGWQERYNGFKKQGSYAVGILPEFRNNGLARDAINQLIRLKSAGVDEVCAYVCPHNKPSIGLAQKLNIPVKHSF